MTNNEESKLSTHRHELIRLSRTGDMKGIGEALEGYDADDTEWFLKEIEKGIEEKPHHVNDAEMLAHIEQQDRFLRDYVSGVLHTKRTNEKRVREKSAIFRANLALIFSGLAVVILITTNLEKLSNVLTWLFS